MHFPPSRLALILLTLCGSRVALCLDTDASRPMTKAELSSLIQKRVDQQIVVGLIGRQCVDFDVTPTNAVELSSQFPKAIIAAVMDCRDRQRHLAEGALAASQPAPPATTPTPPGPAQVRLECGGNCFYNRVYGPKYVIFLDYAGNVSLLKRASPFPWGSYLSDHYLDEFPIPALAILLGTCSEKNVSANREACTLTVPAGEHRLTIYAQTKYHRNDITYAFQAGQRYVLKIRENLAGITLAGIGPD